jgi:Zn-dependent protease with chaperone function
MSNPIDVQWLSGKNAQQIAAELFVDAETVRVVSRRSVDESEPRELARAPRVTLQFSEQMSGVPLRVGFPDGGIAVVNAWENDRLASSLDIKRTTGFVHQLERNSLLVVLAIVALGALMWYAHATLAPKFAAFAADRIPRSAELKLGEISLKSADRLMLNPTRLSDIEQAKHRDMFDRLAQAAGLTGQVNLQFRRFEPNALAFPGGTIVLTDGLVKLMNNDERLVGAVLAHEIGHIHHRHSLRQIIQGSLSALLVGVLAGDVSGMSTVAISAPTIMASLSYTRDGEREADQYAHDLLTKVGLSPKNFANAMKRFSVMQLCMELREQDKNKAKFKSKEGEGTTQGLPDVLEPDESDDYGKTPPREAADRKKREKHESVCTTAPDEYLKGRDADVATLRHQRHRERTGYMHTHPVVQERIDAAEAAAEAAAEKRENHRIEKAKP